MLIQYVFDILIVSFVVVVSLNGFRRGFLTSAISMGAKLAAILAAVLLHVPFSRFLDTIFRLRQKITPAVSNLIDDKISQKSPTVSSTSAEPLFGANMQDVVTSQLTSTITSYILKIISFLVLLLIIYLVASILINFFIKPLTHIKPISYLDKFAGLLVSCVCVIFLISLFCGLTEPFWLAEPKFDSAIHNSFSYPILMKAYTPLMTAINTFFSNIFLNPLDALPTFYSVQI